MSLYRILPAALLSAFTLLAAAPLAAHTSLAISEPAADEVLSAAPEELMLRFTGAVTLVQAELKDSEGKTVDTGFTPTEESATKFAVPLPALQAGRYTVEWTVVGVEDGHTMLGDFSFTVGDGAGGRS